MKRRSSMQIRTRRDEMEKAKGNKLINKDQEQEKERDMNMIQETFIN